MSKQRAKTAKITISLNAKLKKRLDASEFPMRYVIERALVQFYGLDPDTFEEPGADVEMVNQLMDAKETPARPQLDEDEDEDEDEASDPNGAPEPQPGTREYLFATEADTGLYINLPEPYDGVPWENTIEAATQSMQQLGCFYREVESGRVVMYHPVVDKVVHPDDFGRIMQEASPEMQEAMKDRFEMMVLTGHGVLYEFIGSGFLTSIEANNNVDIRSMQDVPADGPQPEPVQRKTGPTPAKAYNQMSL